MNTTALSREVAPTTDAVRTDSSHVIPTTSETFSDLVDDNATARLVDAMTTMFEKDREKRRLNQVKKPDALPKRVRGSFFSSTWLHDLHAQPPSAALTTPCKQHQSFAEREAASDDVTYASTDGLTVAQAIPVISASEECPDTTDKTATGVGHVTPNVNFVASVRINDIQSQKDLYWRSGGGCSCSVDDCHCVDKGETACDNVSGSPDPQDENVPPLWQDDNYSSSPSLPLCQDPDFDNFVYRP